MTVEKFASTIAADQEYYQKISSNLLLLDLNQSFVSRIGQYEAATILYLDK